MIDKHRTTPSLKQADQGANKSLLRAGEIH